MVYSPAFTFSSGSAGCFSVYRAPPRDDALISSFFRLKRLSRKRLQLSFLKHCATSVAQCFFTICARRQAGVYEVFLKEKTVRVLRMWTYYELAVDKPLIYGPTTARACVNIDE